MTWYCNSICSDILSLLQEFTFYDDVLCSDIQEFSGVGGLTDSEDLETDISKLPLRTLEILASCHALVFVDNKLV